MLRIVLVSLLATLAVAQSVFNCNFDTNECGFIHETPFRWLRYRGNTPSSLTGPTGDHTSGQGYYSYIEASGRAPNSIATMKTPMMATSGSFCVSFWYHMYGASMGGMKVYLSEGTTKNVIYQDKGNKGNKWIPAQVPITAKDNFQIVFEGIVGTSFRSDAAIDDIMITTGACNMTMPTAPPTTIPTTPAPKVLNGPLRCNFDQNMCDFTHDATAQFKWLRKQGPTPSQQTGPSADHTTGSGFYMFTEASSPQKAGFIARLTSPAINISGQVCVQFYTHMYGINMGTLRVVATSSAGQKQLTSLSGDKGNKWFAVNVQTTFTGPTTITFEGTVGTSFRSDMAIDDVTVIQGSCASIIPTTTPAPTTTPWTRGTVDPSIAGKCGMRKIGQTRIVGGQEATPGKWPWMVDMLNNGRHNCGGTLIAPKWVLTAAHCVRGKSTSALTMRLGEHDQRKVEGFEKTYRVKSIISHPNYGKSSGITNDYDVALIELTQDADMNSNYVNVACMPKGFAVGSFLQSECWATGWGLTQGTGDMTKLQEVKVPIFSTADCQTHWGSKVGDRQICMGSTGTKHFTACRGDSGGPLVCRENGRFVLAGLTSWGTYNCGGKPAVYMRVSAYVDWIEQKTGLSFSNQ